MEKTENNLFTFNSSKVRKFIVSIALFSVVVFSTVLAIFFSADGNADSFYLRFTSPTQSSLILGTSRSAQGLMPEIINKKTNVSLYNYSFTSLHSPFGPTYLKSIRRKLKPDGQNGIFILEVSPWGLSSTCENLNDSTSFRELNQCLSIVKSVTSKPNFSYLLHCLEEPYSTLIVDQSPNRFLHDDGWLEIGIGMDSQAVAVRTEANLKKHREQYIGNYQFSSLRLTYLVKTIEFLKSHGEVFIVRMPMSAEMMEIENVVMPDFNHQIKPACDVATGYLDLTSRNNDFTYTDGSHLHKESGAVISELVGTWIAEKLGE